MPDWITPELQMVVGYAAVLIVFIGLLVFMFRDNRQPPTRRL